MKCFAPSIFKTFLSVVWFIVVVNVMSGFLVVNGVADEDLVIPRNSASNLDNVTLLMISESLQEPENTILDTNLDSTGGLFGLLKFMCSQGFWKDVAEGRRQI